MPDVVVLGGGVAGCAIAATLAAGGRSVTVLERELVYTDKVRGEGLVNWGVQQAIDLGLGEVVLGIDDASIMTRYVGYDETISIDRARTRARDLAGAIPGVPGTIGVGHPELRQALADRAVSRGAELIRGVHQTRVIPGDTPAVEYRVDEADHVLRCRLVVVADGKDSSTRRALGVQIHMTRPRILLTGLLVDDGGAWDRAETSVSVDGRNQYIVMPRGQNRIRLYVGRHVDDERFIGPDKVARFLDAYRTDCLPVSDALAGAEPIGPCASFPMTDSWTDDPVLPGVVLVGDAAGWSNPVTGQGLSIALRDARVVTDLLLGGADWSPDALSAYREERRERMARLRFATALTDLLTAFGADDRAARRRRMGKRLATEPDLARALDAVHSGPWTVPAEAFSPDKLMALALS
jgi:2-polyprenyl-6-methoxyphenol hydroxylase-like FAD-dependent oxidoreductase